LIPAVRQAIPNLHVGLGKASVVCRLYLWFLGRKTAVWDAVRTCTSCQLTRPNPPRDKTASWTPQDRGSAYMSTSANSIKGRSLSSLTPERAISFRIGRMAQKRRRQSACTAHGAPRAWFVLDYCLRQRSGFCRRHLRQTALPLDGSRDQVASAPMYKTSPLIESDSSATRGCSPELKIT